MSVTGTWLNSYGSVMSLLQTPDGLIAGTYQSTTGASGTYLVTGFATANDPTSSLGESLALSIFWRSIEGGGKNPTWHWVSGLGGQMVAASGADSPPMLNLIHAMVATSPDPQLGTRIGTYMDKLTYLPDSSTPPAARERPRSQAPISTDPIEGTWICRQDPAMTLTLQVFDPDSGGVTGSLSLAGRHHDVAGFTDVYAQREGLILQALSVCALLVDKGQTMALAGSLDYASGVITLVQLLNQGTAADSTYIQTILNSLTFTRES